MRRRNEGWLRIVIHAAALIPPVVLIWLFVEDRLGPVPVAAMVRWLGRYALGLLLLSLVPTAIRKVTGFGGLTRVRRTLGLYAFLYAVLHLLAFAGLDYRFNLRLIVITITQSRREIVGLSALLILALLALTSVPGVTRALGKYWKPLHRLVYVAAGLVVMHYAWNYKEFRTWPLVAGATLFLLLLARLPPVARPLREWWRQEGHRPTQ